MSCLFLSVEKLTLWTLYISMLRLAEEQLLKVRIDCFDFIGVIWSEWRRVLAKIQLFWEFGQAYWLALDLPTHLIYHLRGQLWFVDDEALLLGVLPLENRHKRRHGSLGLGVIVIVVVNHYF